MSIFTPIQQFADLATYQWLNLAENSYLGNGINFNVSSFRLMFGITILAIMAMGYLFNLVL